MASLLAPQKTIGFEPPAITQPITDSDSDSEDDESSKMLKKAFQLTTRHRFKQLIGDAVQLDRRNTLAAQDLELSKFQAKQRRLAKMRGAGKKNLDIPKLALLVKRSTDKPIVKFRRMARAVLMLIQVCNVCKEILSSSVKKEPWFALIDNLIAKSTIQQKRKAPRAFVTFVPNERRQLVQLTFDVAEFKRERRAEFTLTDEIRDILSVMPGYRTPQQVAEIIRVMKSLFIFFSHYKLATQKAIGQMAFYDKYKANRVLVKKGHQPDGVFFILSGCVVEKHEGGKQPKIINVGEKFGEADLLCGARRRHTVLTKVDSEIFSLHREDYRDIFGLSDDRNNPKNLDICRQHVVFQHFPMQRLLDNPGTWSLNNYKYGQLIAMDGNNLDWIYVIKSGEARVFKFLQPDNIDVKGRRRKVQALIHSQSPFQRKKRILNFEEERDYIKSAYKAATYHPAEASGRQSSRSAPPCTHRPKDLLSCSTSRSVPPTRQGLKQRPATKMSSLSPPEKTLPHLVLHDENHVLNQDEMADKDNKKDKSSDSKDNTLRPCTVESVIPETVVEEVSEEEGTSRSQGKSCQMDGAGLLVPGSGIEVTANRKKEVRTDNTDIGKCGSQASSKRYMERRLSRDVTGGLFEKVVLPGQPDRRQSILMPTDLAPDGGRRRLSHQLVRSSSDLLPEGTGVRKHSLGVRPDSASKNEGARSRSGSFLRTPMSGTSRSVLPQATVEKKRTIQVGKHTLPAFVQVETLHPGQAFGLRACLDPEERGPSVSLVSGDCEVLQINKKFFMRHCDDAIYSLIRLKNKPFPNEEDLIDRLDINMRWEEYKQQTLTKFLKECRSKR